MGKGINFGSGKPVWRAGDYKWEIVTTSTGDIAFSVNGVTKGIVSKSYTNKYLQGVTNAKYYSGYGFELYPSFKAYSRGMWFTIVSTIDNGTEEFDILYPGLDSPLYQVNVIFSVEDSYIVPKVKIDANNNKIIVERNDESGEEITIHIQGLRQ